MNSQEQNFINCESFEENLSDYLEGSAATSIRTLMSEHILKCPLCHSLLSEVKGAVEVCRAMGEPVASMTGLEARILSATMPQSTMKCGDFEEYLTDYLDGFLPAGIFHRWERHAVICNDCTDLPGEVVRSIAACYTYKVEELPVPEGLNERILQATLGTVKADSLKPSLGSRVSEWIRGLSLPISVPQLAPVAMMLLFAALVFSQTAGTSFGGMYQKGFELAGKTYKQGADIVLRNGQNETARPSGTNETGGGER
jgi:predicted anti-sigma-YlaC factor YlaD